MDTKTAYPQPGVFSSQSIHFAMLCFHFLKYIYFYIFSYFIHLSTFIQLR